MPQVMFMRVQSLRFAAAAAVAAYHAQLVTSTYSAEADPYPILAYAAHGVDLFFVISGFIITFVARTRETTAMVFGRRRIARIVPLYWLLTLFVFGLSHVPGLARAGPPTTLHLAQSLAFMSWIDGPTVYPVLNVGWTLELEMAFYAMFVIAMLLTRRAATVAGLMVLVVSASGQQIGFPRSPMMIEFVLGMMIAASMFDHRAFGWMLLATALTLSVMPLTSVMLQVWMFGLPSAVVVAVAVHLDARRSYRAVLLPELGNSSYSIYLVHVLAISLACKITFALFPHASRALVIPPITVCAVAAGYVVYRLIERRLIAAAPRWDRTGALAEALPIAVPTSAAK